MKHQRVTQTVLNKWYFNSKHCLRLYLLIASCKLRLGTAKKVSDEVCFTGHMDVALVGATAQSFVQGGTVALLFGAIQLPHQDVVRPQHFILTVCAKPVDKITRN